MGHKARPPKYGPEVALLVSKPTTFPLTYTEEALLDMIKQVKQNDTWSVWIYAERLHKAGKLREALLVARWLAELRSPTHGRWAKEGKAAFIRTLSAVRWLVDRDDGYAKLWRNPPWKVPDQR